MGSTFRLGLLRWQSQIIKLNTDKPDGQPRRKLDVSKAKKEFGVETKVSFEEGLKKTVDWYRKNKKW